MVEAMYNWPELKLTSLNFQFGVYDSFRGLHCLRWVNVELMIN